MTTITCVVGIYIISISVFVSFTQGTPSVINFIFLITRGKLILNNAKPVDMTEEKSLVNLSELSFPQLDQLRNQVQQEITVLQSSVTQLKEIQQRLKDSKENAALLASDTEGKDVLVPLTTSMYVPGKLKHNNKMMVNIGTGYYIEKSVKEAEEYFQRRVDHVTKQIELLQPTAMDKVKLRETIVMMMQAKFQAHLQSQKKS